MNTHEHASFAVFPDIIRSRLFFEVASKMMGSSDWPYREPRVELRSHGDEPGVFHLYGANHPDSIQEMAEGKLDIATLNPSALLTLAYRGTGPTHFQHLESATVINLVRTLAWMEGKSLAKTRISRFAALALVA